MLLFASYSGAFGGAERLLIDWAAALEGERCLACPCGPLAEAARAHGIRFAPLRSRPLRMRGGTRQLLAAGAGLAGHALELRSLVVRLDPEVVIAWGMRSAIASLLGGICDRGRPAVVFQHNDMLPGPVVGRLVRRAAAAVDLVTVPSQAVADDLDPTRALGSRLAVVRPGVEVSRFDADAIPAEPPEVLVLGALVGWKRPELALEAAALARRRHPELRLRLVGGEPGGSGGGARGGSGGGARSGGARGGSGGGARSGGGRGGSGGAARDGGGGDGAGRGLIAALARRAEQPDLAGAVELVGPVDDPALELARATCLLHCAEREPFGLAVLEALAAGRPAIVPAGGGVVEIVDSECAALYPPGDASAAARALDGLLSDRALAARMGAAGRERASRLFARTDARRRWSAAVGRVRPPAAAPQAAAAELVSIVTVTHNSAAALGGLLASAERHLPGAEVIVVDNRSSDETVEMAREWAFVRVIELPENAGFGRACNRGVAEVATPVTALLNPDVELIDDSLLALCAIARSHSGASRLLAPLVLSPDLSRQDTVHPAPASLPALAGAVIPSAALPGPLGAWLAPWRAASARPVGWAVGCALVAATATLRGLGPFDERIFLYGEDLDLGLRASRAGVQTWFCPSSRIVHHRAHATYAAYGGEPFELLAHARRAVVRRRLGRRRAAIDDVAQALTFAARIAYRRVLRRPATRERRQLRALATARGRDARVG